MFQNAKHKIFFVIALGFSSQFLHATNIPESMAALGDSITAAALSSYTRTDGMNPFILPQFLFMATQYGMTQSFTAFESRQYSWATGLDGKVTSHAIRLNQLAQAEGFQLQILNAAISGAKASDIPGEVASVLQWSQDNLSDGAPDYVTLEIGPNDLCAKTNADMTPVADFGNTIHDSLEKLLVASNKTHILITGIPNVQHLQEIAANSSLGLPPLSKCQDMWNVVNYCNNILQDTNAADEAIVKQRLEDYMHEFETMTEDFNNKYGADRVRFAHQLYDYNFSDMQISIDCFHPNKPGHQALSDVTWAQTWWANK